MSKSTHQVAIRGVDQTGAAFKSVGARAKATSASIRSIMGGAIAAAAAYLSVRAIVDSVKELGNLSDQAMKAGTSVEFLTKTTTAFQVAGLNIGTDQLVKSMQYLEKATGKTGEGAFYETIESLSKIEDPMKRGAEATKMFGRSALELQPLINGGEEAVRKFRMLADVMPGVSSAAANAGDEAADALTILGNGAQSIMLKAVGKICALWGDEFPGGVRAGALNAINAIEAFCKKAFAWATKYGAKIGNAFNAMWNFAANGYSWEQAWSEFGEVDDIIDRQMDAQLDAIDRAREEYKEKLKQLSIDDLANAFGKRSGKSIGEEAGEAAASAAKRITNQLVLGGSNAARKLQMFGPEYQSEQKKQTALFKTIADNTKQIAENTGETAEAYTPTDL